MEYIEILGLALKITRNLWTWASNMVQQVKTLVAKPHNPSLTTRSHIGENQLLLIVL